MTRWLIAALCLGLGVTKGRGSIEVWLYRGGRLHQDQLHTHGNEAFRVLFRDRRLVLIETF